MPARREHVGRSVRRPGKAVAEGEASVAEIGDKIVALVRDPVRRLGAFRRLTLNRSWAEGR
jgi:hypothetical protein